MKASTLKKVQNIKRKLLSGWYFCMRPLAKIVKKCDDRKWERKRKAIDEMTVEDAVKIYVKRTIKDMIKRNKLEVKYFCCANKSNYPDSYEDGFFLSNLSGDRYNTILKFWYYRSNECKSIGYEERWVALEHRFRELAVDEFIRKGCIVSYIDESTRLDKWFIKQSGYEKTMVVTIK